ncbi:MAG: hypothetical protein ACI4J7_03055 [Ruminiclostridium sp.]
MKGANAAPFTPAGAHGRSTPRSLIYGLAFWGIFLCTFAAFGRLICFGEIAEWGKLRLLLFFKTVLNSRPLCAKRLKVFRQAFFQKGVLSFFSLSLLSYSLS